MEQQILFGSLLAAILGVLGQSIRFIGGMKKEADRGAKEGRSFADGFKPRVFLVSIVIGAVAGVLGYLGLMFGSADGADFAKVTTVLGVVAAGYAGTDFIEAFTQKWLPRPIG